MMGRLMAVGMAMLALCLCFLGCPDSTPAGGTIRVEWPSDATVRSVEVVLYDAAGQRVTARTLNRPIDGAPSDLFFNDLSIAEYRFYTYTYDTLDATGAVTGYARGTIAMRRNPGPPVLVTTLLQPGAGLAILPTNNRVYVNEQTNFVASIRNPDDSFVIAPAGTLLWGSANPDIATIDERTGEATGQAPGTASINVAFGNTGIFATTTLAVSYRPPTVRLTADPTEVNAGSTTKLTWVSSHATYVESTSGFSTDALNGQMVVLPEDTTTYRITVRGPGGPASSEVTVTVKWPAPIVTLKADRTAIAKDEGVTLTWVTQNATEVTSSTYDFAGYALNGSKVVYPGEPITYTIAVKGKGGTASDSVTITFLPPTVLLKADRTTVAPGEAVQLTWTSTGATHVTNSTGGFAGYYSTNGTAVVRPYGTTTYTIEVAGPGGTASDGITVTVGG